MKEGKRSKSCSNMEVDLDRISNLPDQVIGKILSSLPIKEGARTSVLSTKWRYKWAMVPHLVFDHLCPANVVDRVLLSHIGPIRKFQICRPSKDIEDVDRWILPISRHPINELRLDIFGMQPYKMPSCMFSCQNIVHLRLSRCVLKPPSTFKGFRSLKSLHLENVTLDQDVVEHMVSGCPLLERLTLFTYDGFRQLKIDAPNLQSLYCYAFWDEFSLVNTRNLADVHIWLLNLPVGHSSSSLLMFFVDLPKVKSLHIGGHLLKYLACGALLEKLTDPCLHLKFLEISISFDAVEHVSTAICLLRSAPALETLSVKLRECQDQADMGAVNSWLDNIQNCSFTQLRHVKIHFLSSEAELNFVKLLLLSSPVLETMTVLQREPDTADEDTDDEHPDLVVLRAFVPLVLALLQFRRASPNLEIIYL